MQEYTIGSAGSKIQVADVDLSDRSNLDVSNALEGRLQQPRSVDDDLGPGNILVLQQPIQSQTRSAPHSQDTPFGIRRETSKSRRDQKLTVIVEITHCA
jgi:hypothetical protein